MSDQHLPRGRLATATMQRGVGSWAEGRWHHMHTPHAHTGLGQLWQCGHALLATRAVWARCVSQDSQTLTTYCERGRRRRTYFTVLTAEFAKVTRRVVWHPGCASMQVCGQSVMR